MSPADSKRPPDESPPPGMIRIPAGEAILGTPVEEIESLAKTFGIHPTLLQCENPQRRMPIDSFLMDQYEVTNSDYERFIEAAGDPAPPHWKGSKPQEEIRNHPVTHVNWDDAQAYAKWAGKRLPSADEWEYAARGPLGFKYPWGNEWNPERCNGYDARKRQSFIGINTTPVDQYPDGASPFGVMDLAGNVAEWTGDQTRPGPNDSRIVMSSGWMHSHPFHFRGAWRGLSQHNINRNRFLGFRCALSLNNGRSGS